MPNTRVRGTGETERKELSKILGLKQYKKVNGGKAVIRNYSAKRKTYFK